MTTFSTKKAAYEYIIDAGWNIGRSQFYEHIKVIRPDEDGNYKKTDVARYAKINFKRKKTGEKYDKYRERKEKTELETLEINLEKAKHDLGVKQRKFIPRDDHELAIVARAVALMAHINHTIQSSVADWIDIVEGSQSRSADLVAAISEKIEQRMGDFAADSEFDVILEGEE